MQLAVMKASRLGTMYSSLTLRPSARGWAKTYMVRFTRHAATDDARLGRDKLAVFLVAQADRLGDDLGGDEEV